MVLSEFLNRFDKLVVENTQGATASTLRNYLVTIREHVEAFEANYALSERNYSTLEKEHAELKAHAEETIADLEKHNLDLEVRLAAFEQKIVGQNDQGSNPDNLAVETANVLRLFFEKDKALTPEQVARLTKMKSGIAKYHCDKLVKRGFIWLGTAAWADEPPPYFLTDSGRAYLVDNKLV